MTDRQQPLEREDVARLVREVWGRVNGPATVGDETDLLDDLGATSVAAVRVNDELCRRLGIELPLHLLYRHSRAGEYVTAVLAEVGR
jgi:acyl carrier protein